jgi:hypothetical protein
MLYSARKLKKRADCTTSNIPAYCARLTFRCRLHIPPPCPVPGVGLLCNLMICNGGHSMSSPVSYFPTCHICNKPVKLENAKTDESGRIVHEGCYLLTVMAKRYPAPPKA